MRWRWGRGTRPRPGFAAPGVLLRRARCLEGSVVVEVEYVPRPEYGLVRPRLFRVPGAVVGDGGSTVVVLSTDRPLDVSTGRATGLIALKPGDDLTFRRGADRRVGTGPRARTTSPSWCVNARLRVDAARDVGRPVALAEPLLHGVDGEVALRRRRGGPDARRRLVRGRLSTPSLAARSPTPRTPTTVPAAISASWSMDDSTFRLSVTIPPATRARIPPARSRPLLGRPGPLGLRNHRHRSRSQPGAQMSCPVEPDRRTAAPDSDR